MRLVQPQVCGRRVIAADVDEGIERTFRRSGCKAQARKTTDDILQALFKLSAHLLNAGLIAGQCRNTAPHRKRVDTADRVLHHFIHRGNHVLRCCKIAEPRSRHGIGFGKSVDRDGPIEHVTDCCNRHKCNASRRG